MARAEIQRPTELNLTPVLNLVILLIPLLLMAQAGPLAVLESNLPALCLDDCTGEHEALPLRLSLTAAGITLAGHGGHLGESAELVLPCSGVCAGAEDFDFTGLDELLGELRSTSPETTAVVLGAADGIPYEALVGLIDTAREAGLPQMTISGTP